MMKTNLKNKEVVFSNFSIDHRRALINWIKRFDDQSGRDGLNDEMKFQILSGAAERVTPTWPLDWQVPLQAARVGKVYNSGRRKKPMLEITFA